ncbi:lipase family protein, partial [Persephonella sp.]
MINIRFLIVLFLTFLFSFSLKQSEAYSFFPEENDYFDNNYNKKLAIFTSILSEKVYDFDDITLFLQLHGFGEIEKISVGDLVTDTQLVIAKKTLSNGKKIGIIVFRGTAGVRDVLTDLAQGYNLISDTFNENVKVHGGFRNALDIVLKQKDIYSLLDEVDRLIITGHSLGGALATLYGARLYELYKPNWDSYRDKYVVYTFGAAPAGNQSFTEEYDGKFHAHRIIIYNDPVPFLGLSLNAVVDGHVGDVYIYDTLGNQVFSQAFLNLTFSSHSSRKYSEVMFKNYLLESGRKYICYSPKNPNMEKGIFICDDSKHIFYPDIFETYVRADKYTALKALFTNVYFSDYLVDNRINAEKKALEAFLLIDTTGFFEDNYLLFRAFGLKGEINQSKLLALASKNQNWQIIDAVIKSSVINHILLNIPDDQRENALKSFFKEGSKIDIYGYIRDGQLTEDSLADFTYDLISTINTEYKESFGQDLLDIKADAETILSVVKGTLENAQLLHNGIISSPDDKTLDAMKKFISSFDDLDVSSFSDFLDFADKFQFLSSFVIAPYLAYADYKLENLEYKEYVLEMLKPYISAEAYGFAKDKLAELRENSYITYAKAYYFSLPNIETLKNLIEISDKFPQLVSKIPYVGAYLAKISQLKGYWKFGLGVVLNEYEIIKNGKEFKDILAASALSSSLSRYFIDSEVPLERILGYALMENSHILFDKGRFWTGSYNFTTDNLSIFKNYALIYADIASGMVSIGGVGLINNKAVDTFMTRKYIDDVDSVVDLNPLYNVFYAYSGLLVYERNRFLYPEELTLTDEEELANIYSVLSAKSIKDNGLYINQLIYNNTNSADVRFYRTNTLSRKEDTYFKKLTAPNHKIYMYELSSSGDVNFKFKFDYYDTANQKYNGAISQNKPFLLTTFVKENQLDGTDLRGTIKRVGVRAIKEKVEYFLELDKDNYISTDLQISSLSDIYLEIGYDDNSQSYTERFRNLIKERRISAYNFNFVKASPNDGNWMLAVIDDNMNYIVFYGSSQNEIKKIIIPAYKVLDIDPRGKDYFEDKEAFISVLLVDDVDNFASVVNKKFWDYLSSSGIQVLSDIATNFRDDDFSLVADRFEESSLLGKVVDYDRDGLPNIEEVLLGTKIDVPDTDGDTLLDGEDPNPTTPDPISTLTINVADLNLNIKYVKHNQLYNNKLGFLYLDTATQDLYLYYGNKRTIIRKLNENDYWATNLRFLKDKAIVYVNGGIYIYDANTLNLIDSHIEPSYIVDVAETASVVFDKDA